MPIYDFSCMNCGADFDKLVRNAAAVSSVVCPDCQSDAVKKRLSLVASRSSTPSAGSAAASAAACSPGGL